MNLALAPPLQAMECTQQANLLSTVHILLDHSSCVTEAVVSIYVVTVVKKLDIVIRA